ncbi:hypothetical protein HMPREF9347_00093 [Escherichia coli MS 124-1]|nr:hypothetical protein HMPREF9536_01481 [Escherichia coli MS 84-1]EFK70794.1 hypothetical protein HMPREF9347_00093 [Escherichia coli MS 124-1]
MRLCSNARHHSSSDLSFIVASTAKNTWRSSLIFISTLMNYEYTGNRKNRSKGNIIMGL